MTDKHPPGPLALVGSGEYTPAMESTDRFLLDQIGRHPHTMNGVHAPTVTERHSWAVLTVQPV